MARYGQRPENALKRANEFIEVGKPARALDTLYEVFRNKKWAYNWSESVLEPIMFKYLDLCVELKKSHIAKEGLFQYRNMFQSVNVSSLENVIRGYLRAAEERTEAAREQSQQAVVDIDDLDNLATPESLLLSAVSGEDAHDRSDRTILTPWVKFLWESYCQCLELLRTNAHVEGLYHDIARMAFSFCLKYNRKTEFRKLCDKLRKHLEDISKLPAQTVNVSIHKPETQQLNLDTRLVQLDSAIQMELWQEAYKAIEDIHGLMNLSKKLPVPKTMANYYQKLAMVFWKAGNNLFHAAALFKLFQLSKDMKKNISSEELQRMACRVLLATLSIPLPSAHPEFNCFIETDKSPMEKAQRLAVLLHLPQPPSRASLLRDIMRMNVVGLATPRLQELYQWLEVDFDPLLLCSRVESVVNELTETSEGDVGPTTAPLKQYVQALQDVTLVRLIRQLAQVYQTVEFSRMLELARFTDKFHLERLLVDCVRHNDMQIRIDHGKNCINFGMDLSEAQREDKPEGPQLQPMPSEQIRTQLIDMARVLHRAMQTINPHKRKNERDQQRTQMVKLYNETRHREHQRILERHKIIEDRKEYLERLNTVREEEELRRQEELARQQALAEQRRLEQEREERERKRHENEIQQIKDRHLKEKMQQISQTTHGQKILKKLDEDDIKKLDAEAIAAREAEELQKERRELQQRLKSQEKKVDYFERAKRVEELPLFQSAFEEQQIADRQFWNQHEAERIEKLVEERRLAVQHRERLARMTSDQQEFVNKLRAERKSAYEEKLLEFEKTLDEERRKRLAERKAVRKEERRQQWLEEREEEAKRKKEEEARRKAEEEEKAARLQKQQEEDEYRRRKEELDRQEEIRKQREKEVMERREIQERTQSTNSSWRKSNAPIERPSVQQREEERESAPPTETSSGQWRARGAREERPAPTRSNNAPAEPWRPTRAREPDSKLDSWRRGGSERDAPVEKENRDRERQGERDERGDRDRNDRIERNGRDDRNDRIERNDRNGRDERNDRVDRNDRIDRNDRNDRGAWRDDRGDRIANTGGGGGGGSWRSKASEPEDDDRRSRRIGIDRSGAGGPPPERDSWRSSKDSSAPSGTPMRRPGPQAPATPQRRAEEPASAPPLRENRPRAPEQTAGGGNNSGPGGNEEDGNWHRVSRR